LISVVEDLDRVKEFAIGRAGSDVGVGGMQTKIRAAEIVTSSGEMMVIASGRQAKIIDILDGCEIGTLFLPKGGRMGGRKRWIAFTSDKKGVVVVDDGAARAIV
jgi:glutamate 5-kinase